MFLKFTLLDMEGQLHSFFTPSNKTASDGPQSLFRERKQNFFMVKN